MSKTEERFVPIISFLENNSNLEKVYSRIRRQHGLSQSELGKIINGSKGVISKYENNKRDLRFSEIVILSQYHDDFRLAAIAYLEKLESKQN